MKRVVARAALLVVLAAACGGGGGATSPATPLAARADASGWRAGPAFPSPRDHHVTFVDEVRAGAYLYAIGGTGPGPTFLADGFRAKIAPDGAPGPWEKVAPLPGPRAGSGLVVDAHHVVLAGGKVTTGKTTSADVVLGAIDDNGAIAWRAGPRLPEPRFHLTCALARGTVFAIGGLGDEFTATSGVFAAKLEPNGDLGPWTKARGLPSPRSHHASFVHDGRIYVTGGLHGDPTDDAHVRHLDEVVSAEVRDDGTLGEWRTLAPLPMRLLTHAATVSGGAVYLVGGFETDVTDHIWRAALGPAGALGAWQPFSPPLPQKRAHTHQAPVFRGHMYVVSGNGGEHVPIPDVGFLGLGN